jgi:BASS family bile acid:Na+ symporter
VTEFFAAFSQFSVVVFLVSSMSEIGLGLRLHQIVSPLRNARLVALALLANFIIAPFWQ